MPGTEVSILLAMAAGLLSFLSPCVLPLFPSYLSFIAGLSFEELQGTVASRMFTSVPGMAPPQIRHSKFEWQYRRMNHLFFSPTTCPI